MIYKKRKVQKSQSHSRRGRVISSLSVELLVIDNEPIRRQAIDRCRRAIRELDEARERWERHEREDIPAFTVWMNRNFGGMLAELRTLSAEAYELLDMVDLIREIKNEEGVSFYRAWKMAMEMKAKQETLEGEAESESESKSERNSGGYQKKENSGEREDDDPFASLRSRPAGRPASNDDAARLRELYRMLVRKLHPDYGTEWNERISQLWHEVQTAYGERNLERLETLAALCDIHLGEFSEKLPVSRMNAVYTDFSRRLKSLKRMMREAQKEPAWDFSRRSDRRDLFKKIKNNLSAEIAFRRLEVDELQRTLQRWSTPPKPGRRYEEAPEDFFWEL